MLEYTIFSDRGSNSLSHVKSELLVSYSKFPCKQLKFVVKPTVLAAIHNPSFPSIYIATSAACAWQIAAHLCWQRQQKLALGPRRFMDHLGGHIMAAQHIPLVAQPPTRWSAAAARNSSSSLIRLMYYLAVSLSRQHRHCAYTRIWRPDRCWYLLTQTDKSASAWIPLQLSLRSIPRYRIYPQGSNG